MPPDLKSAIGWMYEYIKPHKVLLDVGCSTGYFGSLIKKDKQAKVYGVEVSNDAVKARKVLDGVYLFDVDGEWPAEVFERKYDYVFFGDVLEHLKRPDKALEQSLKLLQKGGKAFVSIPNIAHISTRLELLQGSFQYEPMGILDNTHLKYFTYETFTQLADKSGFKVVTVNSTVNDYPREIINKLLKKVGLNPTEKFWDITETLEARAYQYKFVLEPNAGLPKQKTLVTEPLPPKPEQLRDSFIDDLRMQVKIMDNHSREQAKIIEHYSELSKRLEIENQKLKKKFVARATGAVKRQIKRKRG